MEITAEYFQNTLLPGASAVDVCQTLCQWHTALGYQRVHGRQLFDYRDFGCGERRAFLLSNEKWCVVLHSSDTEIAADLRRAFAQFPAVVQLWAQDGAWGYRLEEHGRRITAYCSKAVADLPDEPRARQRSELKHLVAVCGVPNALGRLHRLEKRHFLFARKACAEFAGALEVPVAVSTFRDADRVTAGMAEERHAHGWNCRLLVFKKAPAMSGDPTTALRSGTSTPAQRAKIIQQQVSRPKQMPFYRLLLSLAGGVPRASLNVGQIVLTLCLGVLACIPGLRLILLGRATLFCEGFWKEVRRAEPKRIQIRGDLALNTRHRCSIIATPPARVLLKFQPRKPIPGHEPVFDIQVDSLFVSCMAYPNGQLLRTIGAEVLEERSFPIDDFTGNFLKRRQTSGEHQRYQYVWTVPSPRAAYQFVSWAKEEMTSGQLEGVESMVRSFKIEPEPACNGT